MNWEYYMNGIASFKVLIPIWQGVYMWVSSIACYRARLHEEDTTVYTDQTNILNTL